MEDLLKGGVLLWETDPVPVGQKLGMVKCTRHPLAMQGVDGMSAELEPPAHATLGKRYHHLSLS